ncbi:MAG TPA: acyl-CoA carboxylase epsilon subunit [Ornithinicoccus sp.]|nr:acyl-CoA carboxylase epsilon subunit [Ornithinicoccus sp.]
MSAEGKGEAAREGTGSAVPSIRVVSGSPSAEEVAAVVAVLAAASGGGNGPAESQRSLWKASTRAPGHRPLPGPGVWRASGLPR